MQVQTESAEERVSQLVYKIQTYVLPRRIRVREFFTDFDPLKAGRCTKLQFTRAIAQIGAQVTDDEAADIAEHFRLTGERVQKPQDISYVRFCECVDEIYNDAQAVGADRTSPSSLGDTGMRNFQPNPLGEEEEALLEGVLYRLASLLRTRGVILKDCFTDITHGTGASPVSSTKRRSGQITVGQFLRFFPFPKDFNSDELKLICQRYAAKNGDFNYYALHKDVSEAEHTDPPPFPMSTTATTPTRSKREPEWTHAGLSPLQIIQTQVVERRLRLYEHFQDFDPLRKGRCTFGQVKTTFTILRLDSLLSRNDLELLLSMYSKDGEFFDYVTFCRQVEAAFTKPHLEKDPLAVVPPGTQAVMAMRRNKMQMTPAQREKLNKLEDKIRSKVKQRGMLIKPLFCTMDKRNWGRLTVTQFARCMSMLGFDFDDQSIDLLCHEYCDLGSAQEINYVEFCKSCDPPSDEVEAANQQMRGPYSGFVPSKYFDDLGAPVAASGRVSPLIT
mmetsp:Transcript_40240/g.92518  ORF Transcript_40240/g.92518 Transcript_40240/m.92518 type:complete len:502 (+) Transcript_40240:126-1631(+)